MKKLFLILTLLIFSITSARAADNYLNTVILEGAEGGYNVILRSDSLAAVKRIPEGQNKLTLEVKGATASNSLSTIYKNTSEVLMRKVKY